MDVENGRRVVRRHTRILHLEYGRRDGPRRSAIGTTWLYPYSGLIW